ncbi:MAG: TetR-like C-terminal domain-containing protein [Bdellovibrionota bacterium]
MLGEAYIEFGLQNPGYYRAMFGVDYGSELNEELRKSCYESFYILLDTIGQRSTENATKAFYSWSLVHGFVMLNLDGQIQGPMNEFKIVTRPALFSDLIHHLVSMK